MRKNFLEAGNSEKLPEVINVTRSFKLSSSGKCGALYDERDSR